MKTRITILALWAAMMIAGCSAQSDSEETKEATAGEPTPSPEGPVSILRPEVEPPDQTTIAKKLPPPPLNLVIGFPEGGATLDAKAVAALRSVLDTAQFETGAPIILRGHSDTGGTGAINERVSRQRAEAVRDWLVDNDVAEDRIEIIAFGEQNPAEPNAKPDGTPNEKGRAANRRVELQITPLTPQDPDAISKPEAEATSD